MRFVMVLAICLAWHGVAWGERAKIAIVPFTDKVGINPITVDTLVDMLTTALTKAQKFEVIERNALDKVVQEQNFGAGGSVEAESAARMGKISGADYLVIGVVTEAGAAKRTTAAYGVVSEKSSVSLAIDLRFVDAESGSTKISETFRETRTGFALAADGSATIDVSAGPGGEMARALIDKISAKVMTSVYPPKVVKVEGGAMEVILNYGEAVFTPSQVWDVFAQGEDLTDPDTGEKLGKAETKIGQIRITSCDLKTSRGKILDGAQIVEGAVCRKVGGGTSKDSGDTRGGGEARKKVNPF